MQAPTPVNIRSLKSMPSHLKPSIVALGNFDGVHIGHQELLKAAQDTAKKHGIESVVVLTFDPHPSRFFRVETFAGELQKFEDKIKKLQTFIGQDASIEILEFNHELANLSPEDFCYLVLHKWLKAKFVVVGSNFRFGKARSGNVSKMTEIGKTLGFRAIAFEQIEYEQEVVSSSRIRKLICDQGFVHTAAALLGEPYEFTSFVVEGQRLGRKLGFPTLNMSPIDFLLPKPGVYIVRSSFEDDGFSVKHLSVMNIGVRPTVSSLAQATTCEVHVIERKLPELYGQKIRVEVLDRIRDEKKFSTTTRLISAIQTDIEAAKNFDESTQIRNIR
jgi:riboflavin kinase/FMN adenylyltransferase